ncbi:MAG: pyridoxamine 5'-phosphate oxidase family protein [Pseudomonadota bacterium]
MAKSYAEIAFTDPVLRLQQAQGSAKLYAAQLHPDAEREDRLTAAEVAFLSARDGFYQATVSATGWPYVQFRGGPAGFVHVLDDRTIAYADFRGNRQYISTGNLSSDDRVALFFMDYPNKRRLKMFGHVCVVDAADDPALLERLMPEGYRARAERAIVMSPAGFDWNCPQHIPQRMTVAEYETAIAPLREHLGGLQAENEALKAELERLRGATQS